MLSHELAEVAIGDGAAAAAPWGVYAWNGTDQSRHGPRIANASQNERQGAQGLLPLGSIEFGNQPWNDRLAEHNQSPDCPRPSHFTFAAPIINLQSF